MWPDDTPDKDGRSRPGYRRQVLRNWRGQHAISARNASDCSVRYDANQSRKMDGVRLRYYIDPSAGEPHIYNHDVEENEVEEVLGKPIEDRVGSEGSRIAIGQTQAGRYLRVIYIPDPQPDSGFVITAYDLGPKALKALTRRRRRKK